MGTGEEMFPGTFWLPEDPDRAVPGRLYLSGGFRLELEGSLTSAMDYWEETDHEGNIVAIAGAPKSEEPGPFTVLGDLRANREHKVSLFECMTVGRSGDIFMLEDSAQTVRPLYGLRGVHADSPSGVSGVRVELLHGTEWSRASGFEATISKDGTHTVTYTPPAAETSTLANGAVVQLVFSTTFEPPGPGGASFRRSVAIEVDGFDAISIRDAERMYEVPLSSLVALCLLRDSPSTGLFVRHRDGHWAEVVSGSRASFGREESGLRPGDLMLTLPDIGIEGVARWLDRVEPLGPLPPVIAKAAGSRSIQLETMLFDLTSVAEGLHTRLFDKFPGPVAKETARSIRASVEKHLTESGFDEADVAIAVGCLGGMTRPSYRDRLRQLRDHTGGTVDEVFGTDFDGWTKAVADCRNGLAHRKLGFVTPESSGLYAAVVYSLRWFLVAILLLETGILPEKLREKIQQKQSYQLFVRQAPDMLPGIYGKHDDPAAPSSA